MMNSLKTSSRCSLVFRRLSGSMLGVLLAVISTHGQLLGPSSRRDIEQGAEVAKLVEQQYGLCALPATEAYLREVGGRLVAAANDSRWNFTFHIVNQSEPNAFAIPGGGVYVSRGLLVLVNREDELAGVLAHEIAHVTERHSMRQERRGFLPSLLSLPGNVVGNVVGENLGALINAPIETVGGAWMSRYSRGQESESDRLGIRTAARAGYDPAALADMLERLEQDAKSQTGEKREFSIFDSHPMTATRTKDIQRLAPTLKPVPQSPVAGDAAALFNKFEGLWWGQNPETGVFQENQFLQPRVGFTITFPAGWKHHDTPEYVVSVHPKKEAMLLLGVEGPASDPELAGNQFIAQMRQRARMEPVSTRKSVLGAFPVFIAIYSDASGRRPVHLHCAWIAMGETTYQLIGLASDTHRETLRQSALTLRPMTQAERRAVTGKRIRVVAANKNERLDDFGARTGNVWSPIYTALVNGLDAEAVLTEGQLLKTARLEPVLP